MRRAMRGVSVLLVGLLLLMVPDSGPGSSTLRLVRVESARAVDFDEVVWVLAVGSDSRTDDVADGNTDAIELIGVDLQSGAAVALGIPRDLWVDLDGFGYDRINAAYSESGGPGLLVDEVEQLLQIRAQYVLTVGFLDFSRLVDSVGGLVVRTTEGRSKMDGEQALALARSRDLPGDDFARIANQQRLLRAILAAVRAQQDDDGFVEQGARAALRSLDTNLSPTELYRLAQGLGQIQPSKVTTCVLRATPENVGGADVLILDATHARRLATDARDDATLTRGCG